MMLIGYVNFQMIKQDNLVMMEQDFIKRSYLFCGIADLFLKRI